MADKFLGTRPLTNRIAPPYLQVMDVLVGGDMCIHVVQYVSLCVHFGHALRARTRTRIHIHTRIIRLFIYLLTNHLHVYVVHKYIKCHIEVRSCELCFHKSYLRRLEKTIERTNPAQSRTRLHEADTCARAHDSC